jgi:hypothetical protein
MGSRRRLPPARVLGLVLSARWPAAPIPLAARGLAAVLARAGAVVDANPGPLQQTRTPGTGSFRAIRQLLTRPGIVHVALAASSPRRYPVAFGQP